MLGLLDGSTLGGNLLTVFTLYDGAVGGRVCMKSQRSTSASMQAKLVRHVTTGPIIA